MIESYLADQATLQFGEDDAVCWIIPLGDGSPIQVRVEGDACIVLAGFSFRVTLEAGIAGSEWMVIDCIEAIIGGNASEFYDFASNHLRNERSDGVARVAFSARSMGIEQGASLALLVRRIPAWGVIPLRPVETTMDAMWGDEGLAQ